MIDALIANMRAAYGWKGATTLVSLYSQASYRPLRYLRLFWTTQNFATIERQPLGLGGRVLKNVVGAGMIVQIGGGIWLAYHGITTVEPSQTLFGTAALLAYPLIWAHVLVLVSAPGVVMYVKPFGKRFLGMLLERQVMQLRRKHQFAVVAVAGSVGKTSTKLAIADALRVTRRVQHQVGNYNDRLTVPLIFFGHEEPGIYNIFAWLKILRANRNIIKQEYPYDVVVVELAPDVPGDMAKFAYLQPEVGVLTAVAPEHMEVFGTIEAVAKEETAIFEYCQKVLVNTDDVASAYLLDKQYISYGTADATYALLATNTTKIFGTQRVTFNLAGRKLSETIQLTGLQGAKVALAAAAAISELALSEDDIKLALKRLRPFAGRMQILPGIKGSTLIDDTYNASPAAIQAALDVLYAADVPQRIALLGNMNEMGEFSQQAHTEIGKYCDAKKLDLVVTLGVDANTYLAEAAREKGCRVVACESPTQAGELIASELQKSALVLLKGSQNGVFAEEAVKVLLQKEQDATKLVRQSPYWMKIKQRQFGA